MICILNGIGNIPNSTIGTADGINIWWWGSLKGKLYPQWSIEDHLGIPQEWCRMIFELNNVTCWGGQVWEQWRELCKVCNDFCWEVQKDRNKKMYRIKIDTSWTNDCYTSAWKGDHRVTNGKKKHMHVGVNCKSGDDWVYWLANEYCLDKT